MRQLYKNERSYKSFIKRVKERASRGWELPKDYRLPTRIEYERARARVESEAKAQRYLGKKVYANDLLLNETFSTKHDKQVLSNRVQGLINRLKKGYEQDIDESYEWTKQQIDKFMEYDGTKITNKNYYSVLAAFDFIVSAYGVNIFDALYAEEEIIDDIPF